MLSLARRHNMTKIIQWYDPIHESWFEGVVLAHTSNGSAVIEEYEDGAPYGIGQGVVVVPDAKIRGIQNETME